MAKTFVERRKARDLAVRKAKSNRRLGMAMALFGSSSVAMAASPDPCSLLTSDQVTAALGFPVGTGTPLANGCGWHGSGKQAVGKRATVYLQKPDDFAIGKTALPGIEKPAVSGVGDDAYYGYMSEPRYSKIMEVTLTVKKGGQVVGIQVWGYPVDDAKQKAKALALAVLAQL